MRERVREIKKGLGDRYTRVFTTMNQPLFSNQTLNITLLKYSRNFHCAEQRAELKTYPFM